MLRPAYAVLNALSIFVSFAAWAEDIVSTARVYDSEPSVSTGGSGDRLLFIETRRETRTEKVSGTAPKESRFVTIETKDPNGNVALIETIEYRGARLVSYKVDRRQIDARGEIRVEKGNVKYEYKKRDGVERDDETFSPVSVVSDQIDERIRENWSKLLKPKGSISLDLMLVNQQKSVGFTIQRTGETRFQKKDAIVFKIAPSSPFIALAIPSGEIVMEKAKPHRRLQYIGRKFLKIKRSGSWEDLDAKVVYDLP